MPSYKAVDAYSRPECCCRPSPMIGHGITSLIVYCVAGLVCADDMVMVHIPRHRRFVCTRCAEAGRSWSSNGLTAW
jgi:hypothetical protein